MEKLVVGQRYEVPGAGHLTHTLGVFEGRTNGVLTFTCGCKKTVLVSDEQAQSKGYELPD